MTEEEWLANSESGSMLSFLQGEIIRLVDDLPTQEARDQILAFLQCPSTRKLRLFACWCCRRIWNELIDVRSRSAVELTERFVDGLATQEELSAANLSAITARNVIRGNHIRRIAANAACSASVFEITEAASESAVVVNSLEDIPVFEDARVEHAHLLRCIFGNPFRPVALDPEWHNSTVVQLAQGIYADRAFDRLPILADALQDAGCDHPDVLTHCRSTGPHARGCWVVDLILGKA
jgi:hypothetical protein